MTSEGPGVADQLFTITYRRSHLTHGAKRQRSAYKTKSCFDVTGPISARAAAHTRLNISEEDLPYWSPETCSFRLRGERPNPQRYLLKDHGAATLGKRINIAPRPPPCGACQPRANPPNTLLRTYYERGDLPIALDHHGSRTVLRWKISPENLDYHQYLPIFVDGIRETQELHRFMAVKGTEDLLKVGGRKILPVIPQLIIPLKTALNTRDHQVVCVTLRLLQLLATSAEHVGEALVPYYRQLLPVLNLFAQHNQRLGDGIMYGQQEQSCLGDLIAQTLQLLERTGGPDAFINIKYIVPTYESCVYAP